MIIISPLLLAVFALFLGSYDMSPRMVLKIIAEGISPFSSGLTNIPERSIIMDIRLPRIILAGLVGIALSVSGVTLQGIFRNPLVDPFILGISAGAALGCAVSIGFFPAFPVQALAFCSVLSPSFSPISLPEHREKYPVFR